MKRRRTNTGFNVHRFYCLQCGREGIPLARPVSTTRSAYHRKKLYCPWCKETLNFIEIRNEKERLEFVEAFDAGDFVEEAKESIEVANHEYNLVRRMYHA